MCTGNALQLVCMRACAGSERLVRLCSWSSCRVFEGGLCRCCVQLMCRLCTEVVFIGAVSWSLCRSCVLVVAMGSGERLSSAVVWLVV